MRTLNGSFYRTDEVSREPRKTANWLEDFAEQQALKEAAVQEQPAIKTAGKTAVEVMRSHQPSIYEMMSSIISKTKSKYSSVEEAVLDYQKRTGLSEYLQKNEQAKLSSIAQVIIAEASSDESDSGDDSYLEHLGTPISRYLDRFEEGSDDVDYKGNPQEGTDLLEYLITNRHSNKKPKKGLGELESILQFLTQDADKSSANDEDFDIDTLLEFVNKLAPGSKATVEIIPSTDSNDAEWDDKKKSLISESLESKAQDLEGPLPEILQKHPALKSFITNTIDTNYGIQIPAILQSLIEVFGRDGITQQIFSDKELMNWINKILISRHHPEEVSSIQLGRGVGTKPDNMGNNDPNNDPFRLLTPNKGMY